MSVAGKKGGLLFSSDSLKEFLGGSKGGSKGGNKLGGTKKVDSSFNQHFILVSSVVGRERNEARR